MVEGFRETLCRISALSWSSVALALGLLVLDPTTDSMGVLGIAVARSRLLVVGPLSLIGLGALASGVHPQCNRHCTEVPRQN